MLVVSRVAIFSNEGVDIGKRLRIIDKVFGIVSVACNVNGNTFRRELCVNRGLNRIGNYNVGYVDFVFNLHIFVVNNKITEIEYHVGNSCGFVGLERDFNNELVVLVNNALTRHIGKGESVSSLVLV